MAKYVYPAIFKEEKNGDISVTFPDFEGCSTFGHDIIDALAMGQRIRPHGSDRR